MQESCVMKNREIDEFDRELLELLQEDATRTLDELGAIIGLSGPAVQRRLKHHRETGLIQRTVAQVDPVALGVPITVLTLVTLERDSGRKADALRKKLADHPNVQLCYEIAGTFDLMAIIAVPNMEAYRRITEALFNADDNVRRFASHVALNTIKATLRVPL